MGLHQSNLANTTHKLGANEQGRRPRRGCHVKHAGVSPSRNIILKIKTYVQTTKIIFSSYGVAKFQIKVFTILTT